MRIKLVLLAVFSLLLIPSLRHAHADEPLKPAADSSVNPVQDSSPASNFGSAAATVQKQLTDSLAELNKLRDSIAKEKIPLSRKLSDLEGSLTKARLDYQQTTRTLDSRLLDLSNLTTEIKTRQEESTYLANILSEYSRNFESGLHITEIQRYQKPLEEAKLAVENTKLSQAELYKILSALVGTSIERLTDALGGTRFQGKAVVAGGIVKSGTFVLVGPAALFKSDDGQNVGTAEQRLGSLEPTVIAFDTKEDAAAASNFIADSQGVFPLDPTLGNAHKVEGTKRTLWEHIRMGGMIMYPILLLGAAAMAAALYKWYTMFFLRKPSRDQIKRFLDAVAHNNPEDALREAEQIGGPTGKMLAAGVEQITGPRELIEEVMYEVILSTKLKLNSLLPFIALSATCAPLLGLLGTVTGIITTFSLITVFGSGDPKTLSGGISEALIGTEYGLYVAIPSLVLHAFLLRKAKGAVEHMEKTALAFINQLSKAPVVPANNGHTVNDR